MSFSEPKSFIIEYDEEDGILNVLHRYPGNPSRKDRILYHSTYEGHYIVHITEYDEGDAKKKALDIVRAKENEINSHGLDYAFPEFIKGTSKMMYGATLSRDMYILDHLERMKELTNGLIPSDKWNWNLLHDMKVTSQEYVILFSDDAGDMYARGICDKYYHGKWNEEKYGDSFKKQ